MKSLSETFPGAGDDDEGRGWKPVPRETASREVVLWKVAPLKAVSWKRAGPDDV